MKTIRITILSIIFIIGTLSVSQGSTISQPVPDTGITKCYNDTEEIPCPQEGEDFYGQDGNYSINPMSYTKLDDNGNDLPITATSWAMVRDNVTGLIWENKNNMDDVQDYANPHDADNTYTWYDSNPVTNGEGAGTEGDGTDTEDFIKALNDSNFGGHSDWRLPTIKELSNIVDYSCGYPAINTNYFKDTFLSSYWSSTTFSSNKNGAWIVHFDDGYTGTGTSSSKYNVHYVRAVNGGKSVIESLDNFIINGNGTVTDSATGLMWQQDTPDNSMTWEEAISYCKNLNLGGYTDWRLPTIKELRSIVDLSTSYPTIDINIFKDINVSTYWSSTTRSSDTGSAWGVDFIRGSDDYPGKSSSHYVWAVRNVTSNDTPTPTVTTNPATSITSTGATLNGTYDSGEGTQDLSKFSAMYFEYGTTTDYGATVNIMSLDVGTVVGFSSNITNLTPNTTYHFRLVMTDDSATYYGEDQTFTAYLAPEVVKVLTPSSPNATVAAGECAKLIGFSQASSITIEAGAVAKLINFPGSNTITINGDSTNFKILRSGAMVKFEGLDGTAAQGTVVQLPATKIEQTIIFNDVSAKLVIENNKVMFGTQSVTLSAEGITGAEQTPYTKLDENGNDLPVTAESWSMVRDNTTGLIWENKNSMDGVKDYTNPNDSDNYYIWYDSNPDTNGGYAGTAGNGTDTEDFIKALNDANFGGYSDWRLPTIDELGSIVDKTIPSPGPTINANYFKDTIASFYWSSTASSSNTNVAWGVHFDYGYGDNANKDDYYYVRAVRVDSRLFEHLLI